MGEVGEKKVNNELLDVKKYYNWMKQWGIESSPNQVSTKNTKKNN
jgi:hypothetical protein